METPAARLDVGGGAVVRNVLDVAHPQTSSFAHAARIYAPSMGADGSVGILYGVASDTLLSAYTRYVREGSQSEGVFRISGRPALVTVPQQVGMRMVGGIVDMYLGTIWAAGSLQNGYSVELLTAGRVRITLTQAFNDPPAVTATAMYNYDGLCIATRIQTISESQFVLESRNTGNDQLVGAIAPPPVNPLIHVRVHFMAYGA